MQNFKVIKTENSALHSVSGILKVLSETDGWKQKVELWLLNDITNNNDWRYERLEEHRHLFAETPILVAYVGNQIGDGHNFQEVRNPDGSIKASFMSATAERIVGFFRSESDIRMEVKDGKKWVVGTGYIWKWYAQELVEKIKQQGLDGQPISIETLIDEMHKDGSTEVFTKYQILGTTILGDDVNPAVSGANIRALSEIGAKGLREMTIRVASEQQNKNNPQKQNSKKENKPTMKIKDLKGKFNGFTILGLNSAGDKVALLSNDKKDLFVCSVTKDNNEVIEGKKIAVNGSVILGDGENEVKLAFDAVMEKYNAENAELTVKLADKESTIKALTEANEKMAKNERERRREAVKNAIKARYEKIKKNGGADFTGNECDDLMTDAKIDYYIDLEDCDGKWIGDKQACADVDSRCMDKIVSANEARANAQNNQFNWQVAANGITKENNDDTAIDKAIANILK